MTSARVKKYKCMSCGKWAPHTIDAGDVDQSDADRAGWFYVETVTCGDCGASTTGKVYPHLLDFVFSVPANRRK